MIKETITTARLRIQGPSAIALELVRAIDRAECLHGKRSDNVKVEGEETSFPWSGTYSADDFGLYCVEDVIREELSRQGIHRDFSDRVRVLPDEE